ncbi:MAG: efflux RND transporter permease subunit [Chloroflexi bacterium]|nr:efflux RND transporter permease subunit [Chloroflexota bacterium]
MSITQIAVRRPLTTAMFILALVLLGGLAYTRLQVARFPRSNFPNMSISVGYPGASAQDVDQLVAVPIARAMNGLPGVTGVSSTSREGNASIQLSLADNSNVDQLTGDIQRRLASMAGRLPADISPPSIIRADNASFPIMNVALSGGNASLGQLYDLAVNNIAPALQSTPGVAQVNVVGGLQSQVQILVDPTALDAYGITLQQVQSALTQDNVSTPGGTIHQGTNNFEVRVSSRVTSIDQYNNIVVRSGASGIVYLRNVATVLDTYAPQQSIQRINGAQSVGFSVVQQGDANTIDTVAAVKAQLDRYQRTLPPGVKFTITNDASRFTKGAIGAVQRDLLLAVLICGVVLLLFLHAWRNTVIVLLAIPTSMVSTFFIMYLLHFTLDTISLMALALLVGILVDDSIVVLENIHRHRQLGEEPLLAAVNGRNEIGLAALAITLTDIVVYVPLTFMRGSLGTMFTEFGLVVVAATLFSLFVSFTLTPMLAAHWLRPETVDRVNEAARKGLLRPFRRFGATWDGGLETVKQTYRHSLSWSLRHRPAMVLLALAVFAAVIAFIPLNILSKEYAPTEDDSQFSLQVQMPPGTDLDATNQAVLQLEDELAQIPEVEDMFTSVGGFGGTNGSISVQLVDKSRRSRSTLEILAEARSLGRSIPGITVTGNVQSPLGGGGNPINVRITGSDGAQLDSIATSVLAILQKTPGVTDAKLGQPPGIPELQATVDRSRMAPLGISSSAVASTVRTAISGSMVTYFDRPDGTQAPVIVRLAGANAITPAQFGSLPVYAPALGKTVRLDQIASFQSVAGPSQINRSGQLLSQTVNAGITGRVLGDVAADVQAELKTLTLPPGYRVSFTGQVDRLNQAFGSLLQMLAISIILVFMLLAALFENLLQPLAIMVSLPLALVGAFGGLALTGNTLNIFSMIGIIMLMGLVAKNAILLIDYTNTLRKRNVPRNEAIVEAGEVRLRPILMTTATVVFAMVPLALKLEAGAESRAPIAVVLIGGVTSSLVLTLVIVPVAYTVLEDIPVWLRRLAFALRRAPKAMKSSLPRPAVAEVETRPEPGPAAAPERFQPRRAVAPDPEA